MKVFTLDEFREEYFNLCEDTLNAIKELEDLTNKGVVFRVVNQSEAVGVFKLKIKLARQIMDNHIIIINKDLVPNKNELNYLIVHEIMHGLRTFKAKPEERRVLAGNRVISEELSNKLRETLNPQVVNLMDDFSLNEYFSNLIFNTNMLLFNASVDARIELDIYNKYPNLRKLQKTSQINYLNELLAGFNKKATESIPLWILERANLMNYCYMKKISPIIGTSWTSRINRVIDEDFKNKSDEMMFYLDKEDLGQVSDNETITAWSKILDLDEYTRFTDFENISLDYLFSN